MAGVLISNLANISLQRNLLLNSFQFEVGLNSFPFLETVASQISLNLYEKFIKLLYSGDYSINSIWTLKKPYPILLYQQQQKI